MNYAKVKDLPPDKVLNLTNVMIRACRLKDQSLYVLSHKFEKEGKIWFKGFICLPNQLLQTAYWCEQVLTNKSVVLDFTSSINVPVLKGGIDCIMNPNRIGFSNSKLLKTYTDD